MIYLAAVCIIISMIGLAILLFASFSQKEDTQTINGFVNKESRKIRWRKEPKEDEGSNSGKPSPQFVLLLQTIIIGQFVGLFFLALSRDPLKFTCLAVNGSILLMASFFCSVLALFNVWLKKQTNLGFRIIIQVVTLILGIVLMKFAIREEMPDAASYFDMARYSYYTTVVVAIATMLINVIFGNKTIKAEFNFSNYLIFVIASGLLIGTGLLAVSSFLF